MLMISSRAVIIGRIGWDPDDQLRLVQLRDFLAGQSWFDTTQYRLNPPYGAAMHWSRLIELPLAMVIGLSSPLIGSARAEMLAGTVVPLACLGAMAYMASAITKNFGGSLARLAAVLIVLLAPAILMQTRPMRIDHHGWQAVMAMLGLWTLFWANPKKGGVVLGMALGTWLHISLEGAPITAAFFLILAWRWIMDGGQSIRFFWTLLSFALSSFALFFGTQAAGINAANFCDTISPMHIMAIALGSLILLPALYARPQHRSLRIGAIIVAGLGIVTTILLSSPLCARGAFAGLDPLVREYWYVNVSEGLPIWQQDGEAAWTLIIGALVGVAALAALWKSRRGTQFGTLAFFVIYATLLSFFVFRTVTVAAAFAAIPVAILVEPLIARWRASQVLVQRMGILILVVILIMPSSLIGPLVGAVYPDRDSRESRTKSSESTESKDDSQSDACESVASIRKLSLLPDSNIIAPFDMGPAILMTTRHSVLASSHHRNGEGMKDQIAIFRSSPEKARLLLAKHRITRIAVCTNEAEMGHYEGKDPKGLWAGLAKAQVPNWLENEGVYGNGIIVWRVKDAGNP